MAKILVIDDQPNVRVFLDLLLRQQGYDVTLAENGWTGLQRYRQEHPDVILLDLKMPKLDGVTVLKQIRSVDLKQPVIVFTGECTSETEQAGPCAWSERIHPQRLTAPSPVGHAKGP